MRHSKILKFKQKQSRRGKASQRTQAQDRLANAVAYEPHSYLVFEIFTKNPRNGIENHIQIKHEAYNGSNRYNVYLNGERWRNSWSRSRFANWLFNQIDSVMI